MRGIVVTLLIGLLAFGGGYLAAANNKPTQQCIK